MSISEGMLVRRAGSPDLGLGKVLEILRHGVARVAWSAGHALLVDLDDLEEATLYAVAAAERLTDMIEKASRARSAKACPMIMRCITGFPTCPTCRAAR